MCISVSLSGTVVLGCLFTPKLHIILFQPQKNVASLRVSTNRFSVTAASSHGESQGNLFLYSHSDNGEPELFNLQLNYSAHIKKELVSATKNCTPGSGVLCTKSTYLWIKSAGNADVV